MVVDWFVDKICSLAFVSQKTRMKELINPTRKKQKMKPEEGVRDGYPGAENGVVWEAFCRKVET